MQLSIKIEEVLPVIVDEIRKKYGIKDSVELIYTSKTRFLTFVDKKDEEEDFQN